MTGFGSASLGEISCEIRTVNHRFLSLRINLPEGNSSLEPSIEHVVREKILRGSVNVWVMASQNGMLNREIFGAARLRKVRDELVRIKRALGYRDPIPFETVLALPALWRELETTPRLLPWKKLQPVLSAAMGQVLRMRQKEGASTRGDLNRSIRKIQSLCERITRQAPTLRDHFRERIVRRFHEIVPGAEINPPLFKEIASMLDRCDIAEEVQRLAHHIGQFQGTLRAAGKVGRRLDFLQQEMLRETNTIASKAADTNVVDDTIAIREELERIKEQVENLE